MQEQITQKDVTLRVATHADRGFIDSLSQVLADKIVLDWHSPESVQKMQDSYIQEMLDKPSKVSKTIIAEIEGVPSGFVHVRTKVDDISGETCATIPLLAVTPDSQGYGVGKRLMLEAELWAQQQGCRLLHLEVFDSNTAAKEFYRYNGFSNEIIHMVKAIN